MELSFLCQISNREDVISDLASKEPQLFAHLWSNMSVESRNVVERLSQQSMNVAGDLMFIDPTNEDQPCEANVVGATRVMEVWDDIIGQDALSNTLWINTTHLAPDTGVVELYQEQTRMRYENVKQYSGETILDYKRRFQHAIDAMTAVGIPIMAQSSIAARFIINLDNNRYGAYKADVTNWAKNSIKSYPNTLEIAFESASTYKEATSSVSASSGSAYTTTENS